MLTHVCNVSLSNFVKKPAWVLFLVRAYYWETTKYVCYMGFNFAECTMLEFNRQSLHDCKIQQQVCESWQINCVCRLSLGLSTETMDVEDNKATKYMRQVCYFEKQRTWNHFNHFFILVASCCKLFDKLMCLIAAFNLNAKKCRQNMQEGRRKVEVTCSTRYYNTV